LWDAVSIIIGIVIGTAIFRSPSAVFANSPGAGWAMGLWLLGGMLSWCGAVCYAELATTYPHDGGDYVYLTRAFGRWCGFLFAWAQLTTVLSGNIAIMAYAFADYGLRLWPGWKGQVIWLAVAPILALSLLNMVGVVAGKITQNVLTAAKVVGLGGLVLAGFWAGDAGPQPAESTNSFSTASIGLALVFVLYAYGGWSHAAYVAAEVRDQQRNLPRALMLGLASITLIYLAINATYLAVLGFGGARRSPTPAADVMDHVLGPWGGQAISLLVMLSALGAINGMILTGTRIHAAWGADYPILHWLGFWNRRTTAPTVAIAVQATIAVLLTLVVGSATGRGAFDSVLRAVGLSGLPWEKYSGGFETLVAGSAPVYWGLSLLTGVAVFVLRVRDRAMVRPFKIPLFPFPALILCATCGYMLCASVAYARWLVLLGVGPLFLGAVIWFAGGFRATDGPRQRVE
jgi:amino acid transporter